MNPDSRIRRFDGVRNFRDFGGYAVASGGRIRSGLLYRSGHYAEASEADIAVLDGLGIAVQADLRRPDERERQVAKWSAPETITNDGGRETEAPHAQFLQQVEADAEIADAWMNDYYRDAPFKAHHVALYSDWFDRLAGLEGETAALVNCAAGKDRTGIICALTKHVLGAGEADIVSDYLLTNDAADVDARLVETRTLFNAMLGKDYDAEVYRPFMGVRERYLRTAIDTIEAEAGSVDAYLTDVLGVTETMRAALAGRLVEPA